MKQKLLSLTLGLSMLIPNTMVLHAEDTGSKAAPAAVVETTDNSAKKNVAEAKNQGKVLAPAAKSQNSPRANVTPQSAAYFFGFEDGHLSTTTATALTGPGTMKH